MVSSDKWSKSGTEGWGMGFLLIFFPEDDSSSFHSKKNTLVSLNSPAGRPATTSAAASRIFSKTQTTLSICVLLFFTTLLLFTFSTFEPTAAHRQRNTRRLLLADHPPSSPFSLATQIVDLLSPQNDAVKALQGMGVLYRRGTQAMSELVVAHVSNAVEERQFRSFLRTLHLNGLLSRSDLVFIFSSTSVSSRFSPLIREENDSLLRLVLSFNELKRTSHNSSGTAGLARYFIADKEQKKETEAKEAIWGKGFRGANYSHLEGKTRLRYGSVVGFAASELDPENSLSGFLDHKSMGLWRWACYPMLLGRVRRSYKHMALIDVKDLLILNDPFTRVRNRSPESVYVWTHSNSESGTRGKRKPHGNQKLPAVNPGIVVGGSRGVRQLSDVVLTEIVRAVVEHKGKRKNSVTESGIVNQLVHSGHLLKNVKVIGLAEPVADLGEVVGSGSDSGSKLSGNSYSVVKWGQSYRGSHVNVNDIRDNLDVIKKDLWCWSELHTMVYRDCWVE